MKLLSLAVVLAITSAAAVAAPSDNASGPENRSPVASATLAAKEAGINIGQTVSDRNTNPDNTFYDEAGFDGRGDEVSTLARTK